jgi:hypothetical protein
LSNELVFRDARFHLGLRGATATPQQLTAVEVKRLFVADAAGTFTSSSQRLAYDTKTGQLFSSPDGNNASRLLVVTLDNHPGLGATQLFFIS